MGANTGIGNAGANAVLAIIMLVAIVWGVARLLRRNKDRQEKSQVFNFSPVTKTRTNPGVGLSGQTGIESKKLPRDEFIDQIRANRKSGRALKEYFDVSLEKFRNFLSRDEALDACISLDFGEIEIAALLDHLGYTLSEVAEKIERDYSLSAEEWVSLLLPFSKATSEAEKAKDALEAVEYANATIDSSFVKPLTDHGVSEADAIKIVYDKSNQTLWEILSDLGIEGDPIRVAAIAKQCEVDLSESDEYEKLRGAMDFDKAVTVLRGLGRNLEEIIVVENTYSTIKNDDIKDYLGDLKAAGFGTTEILVALITEGETEVDIDGIVSALEDKTITESEFIDFAVADETDPEDIDSEFEEQNVELRTRVRVLHNLFSALDKRIERNVV